jgi:hypothetical protein
MEVAGQRTSEGFFRTNLPLPLMPYCIQLLNNFYNIAESVQAPKMASKVLQRHRSIIDRCFFCLSAQGDVQTELPKSDRLGRTKNLDRQNPVARCKTHSSAAAVMMERQNRFQGNDDAW